MKLSARWLFAFAVTLFVVGGAAAAISDGQPLPEILRTAALRALLYGAIGVIGYQLYLRVGAGRERGKRRAQIRRSQDKTRPALDPDALPHGNEKPRPEL